MTHALDHQTAQVAHPKTTCDRHAKGKHTGCSQELTPGAPAGSCAFDGAKVVLQPITDVVHLVHGPLACEGNSWDYRHSSSSGSTLYRTSFTTDLTEIDIAMGLAEKRLYASLKQIVARHTPTAVFVYTTCVTALIGDDVAAVCKVASEQLKTPCIPVHSPGFAGSRNLGNRLAADILFDHVIGTVEPHMVTPLDINIIGEFNLCGELWQVTPLFDELGIRVHACLTGDARYEAIASCHRVRANLVICSVAMINLAEKMEARYGIPYAEGSFYGIDNTSNALRSVARLLVQRGADAELLERTEALIAREEARARQQISAQRARLSGKRALLHTGGYKSWSLISALQESGMEVVGTTVRKATVEDKLRARALLKPDAQAYEEPPANGLRPRLHELQADLLISGRRWQYIAQQAGTPWLEINQERHSPYAGYSGTVELIERLDHELHNPIWRAAGRAAPWDEPLPAPIKVASTRALALGLTGRE